MVINDRLKGQHYRSFITKLASKHNIENIIDGLIHYYDNLNNNIKELFDKVTDTRKDMIQKLAQIYEKTLHFKYVLEHFELEVDAHILENFNKALTSFENNINVFVTSYEANLFNHNTITDNEISIGELRNFAEWDRSINIVPSTLGIQWFGGKIKDKSVINKLKDVIRIVKLNTTSGKEYEDYINSNLILEIFLYSASGGITWLQLGQNATFGLNMIVKYQSDESKFNLKLNTESFDTIKKFDLNTFDLDMILNTCIDDKDLSNGNVYIKVKTNIPSNNESGRDQYYLLSSNDMTDYETKKTVNEFGNKLIYHDNKDIEYLKQKQMSIRDVFNKKFPTIKTPNLLNAKLDNYENFGFSTEEQMFNVELICRNKLINQKIYNPLKEEMNTLSDIVSGYVVSNANIFSSKNYFDDSQQFNVEFDGNDIKYYKGEEVIDLANELRVGELNPLIKNETMFDITNVDSISKTHIVPSEILYGKDITNKTIINKITNNTRFENMLSDKTENEVLTQSANDIDPGNNFTNQEVYAFAKIADNTILISTSNGLFKYNLNDPNHFKTKIPLNQQDITRTTVYDIIINKFNKIIMATNSGIVQYDSQSNIISNYGISGGEWAKLFTSLDGSKVYAIRKDFEITREGDLFLYGDSIAVENNINTSMVLIKNAYTNQDNYKCDETISNILRDTVDWSDYNYRRINETDFNVITDPTTGKFFFYKRGNKMLLASSQNGSFEFANFTIVSALSEYNIISAIKIGRKIYLGTTTDNLCYNIDTNELEEFVYNYEVLVNNRIEKHKIYLLDNLEYMFDNHDIENKTPSNCVIYYCNNNLFFVPKDYFDSEVVGITYTNSIYYVLTSSGYIYKYDIDFKFLGIISSTMIPKDIGHVENLLLVLYDETLTTDSITKSSYDCFLTNYETRNGIIKRNLLNK